MNYVMDVVKVDKRGRIVIPKRIREKVKVKEGGYVKIRADEKSIIIEPTESVADKYFGAFKVLMWPEDLDNFYIQTPTMDDKCNL